MVPLCVASRLPLLPFLYIIMYIILYSIFLLLLAQNVSPLLLYDSLTLLNIRDSVGKLPIHDFIEQPKSLPPLLALIPPYLRCPPTGLLRYSCRRRRGRRGGVLCRLRAYLASPSTDNSCYPLLPDAGGQVFASLPEARYHPLPCSPVSGTQMGLRTGESPNGQPCLPTDLPVLNSHGSD